MKKFLLIMILLAQLLFVSNLQASNLILKDASEVEIKGNFNLLLYGGRNGSDIETIAFLDIVDDEYKIELFTPEFNYKKEENKTAKDALLRAKGFVSWHSSFMNFAIRKIITDKGDLIGYEVKPLYLPFEFGISDVFDNTYWLRDKKAVIFIRLLPSIERMLFDYGTSREAN
ncbi:MAG TPA: hypothetical protein HPP56_03810 [Nitrospirae bacterium]|nr:hypothetical protein [Nitrospirota bacterium]